MESIPALLKTAAVFRAKKRQLFDIINSRKSASVMAKLWKTVKIMQIGMLIGSAKQRRGGPGLVCNTVPDTMTNWQRRFI